MAMGAESAKKVSNGHVVQNKTHFLNVLKYCNSKWIVGNSINKIKLFLKKYLICIYKLPLRSSSVRQNALLLPLRNYATYVKSKLTVIWPERIWLIFSHQLGNSALNVDFLEWTINRLLPSACFFPTYLKPIADEI